ncbi:hypothetical protein [Halorussus ruber]|uniref:hypothetical protein n=1 Tax=Halorussus ruber TaxID=1126238 RepID=UPI001091C4BB|nr:hypothetical protein [Halorussus ruber]
MTDHDYSSYPPEAFSDHARGFVATLRNFETETEAENYVRKRAFTPKMWGNWMESNGMGNPHED